ncbi:uncharacterized protein (DUF2147 family) [Neorhizobium sp. 2083]|uniref:DUF2147 domain-containing protein n=1 Tax=Neorhizobium sp. 2083 TaxID=2817762 RepID=UPI00285CD390|nr:DUF2147 domain-containing protein [Neorhizobium sp. 2083]MDR6820822.1 uncharacterized protein (DUF2147 family) [Neorhizobium sp. 2083]
MHKIGRAREGRCLLRVSVIAAALVPGFWGMAHGADLGGQWARGDGKARLKVTSCGSNICAIDTWIKPGTPRKKIGDRLVMTIAPARAGSYSGTAFDPQRNTTCKITVTVNGDRVTTRGCILAGLLCKGIDWTCID